MSKRSGYHPAVERLESLKLLSAIPNAGVHAVAEVRHLLRLETELRHLLTSVTTQRHLTQQSVAINGVASGTYVKHSLSYGFDAQGRLSINGTPIQTTVSGTVFNNEKPPGGFGVITLTNDQGTMSGTLVTPTRLEIDGGTGAYAHATGEAAFAASKSEKDARISVVLSSSATRFSRLKRIEFALGAAITNEILATLSPAHKS